MASDTGTTLRVHTPTGFDMPRVVCSYGYFMLAPNHWAARGQSLTRPVRLDTGEPVVITCRQSRAGAPVRVHIDRRLPRRAQTRVRHNVRRMLRLDEDLTDWFARHPTARRARFGRLFRSPTLFEDMIKTITGCNVTWRQTMRMNDLLCQRIGGGAFPTAAQLARQTPSALKRRCKVGYRAERIVQLARDVDRGRLDLAWFERAGRTSDEVYDALRAINGIGPYAAANLCQLLGFYDKLAIDTETYRHFCHVHNIERPKDPSKLHQRIERHYAQHAPHQFLAYWFELWRDYERRIGDARHWQPEAEGPAITEAAAGS